MFIRSGVEKVQNSVPKSLCKKRDVHLQSRNKTILPLKLRCDLILFLFLFLIKTNKQWKQRTKQTGQRRHLYKKKQDTLFIIPVPTTTWEENIKHSVLKIMFYNLSVKSNNVSPFKRHKKGKRGQSFPLFRTWPSVRIELDQANERRILRP